MQAQSVPYPVTPANVDENVINPSPAFKQEVLKVLGSIVFFVVVYLVLMATSIALAILCGFGGIALIIALPKFITLMLGLGLIGLGGMVIFFLMKFLFKRNKMDRSHLVQINEAEQPELFAFIRKLTQEIQSPFPKRIYISHEVNASVFYDSGFWSMFFPIRKNLVIGMALVNTVNLSEFKAILAHEFGHFSQRSMKLGSYVYNVNKVIFNMLYDNDGYGRALEGWANISGYFAIFASITVKIVQGIQWILQQVYSIINKNYMSLSRQMEFHADAMSAYVSGGDHLVSALWRLDVANTCYERVFQHYHGQNAKPDNVYPQQLEVIKHFASEHGLTMQHGLPVVTASSFSHLNKSRVVIKDQWASHPSTDDREAHLRQLNIHTPVMPDSAWIVFRDAIGIQKRMTEKLYEEVEFKETPAVVNLTSFIERFRVEEAKYDIDKRYKGFYDRRSIKPFDLAELERTNTQPHVTSLNDTLTPAVLDLPGKIEGLKNDIRTLEMVVDGSMPVKTFDMDGKKYPAKDAGEVVVSLKNELTETEKELEKADLSLASFFLNKADNTSKRDELVKMYHHLFAVSKQADDDVEKYITLQNILQPLYYGNMSIEQAHATINQIRLHEVPVKERLKTHLSDASVTANLTEIEQKRITEYVNKNLTYFVSETFIDSELQLFGESLGIFCTIATERTFVAKKELLNAQLRFIAQ